MTEEPVWYRLTAEEAAAQLGVRPGTGLGLAEAEARTREHGRNEITEGKRRGPVAMFLGQFTDFMILVLLAAAVVSGLVGDLTDTLVILVIVVLNAVIGFVQEYRAERAIAALKKLSAPSAHVLRDGIVTVLPAVQLVPGDVVLLEAGQAVPADLRLIETAQLRIEEAALTGESLPVEKHTRPIDEAELPLGEAASAPGQMTGRTSEASRAPESARGPRLDPIAESATETSLSRGPADVQDARMPRRPGMAESGLVPIGDRHNMVFKGTLVTYGRGKGLVVATGMRTELGRIAALLRTAEEVKTPLQKRLARFGRWLSLAVLAICAILFLVGVLRGEPVVLMLLTAISLAVAAIPEALPAVVTVSLALGARKMVSQHVLIRKLPAVETLGSVTFICSDKTGTLTLNRMRVEELYAGGQLMRDAGAVPGAREPWQQLFTAAALSNDARLDAKARVLGDPTEVALYEAARTAGFVKEELAAQQPRVAEIPFEAERARMTTLHRVPPFEKGGQRGIFSSPDEAKIPLDPPFSKGEDSKASVVAYTKGAPETMLDRCRDMLTADGRQPLARAEIDAVVERMAADGLRVLAFATRELPAVPEVLDAETVENDLTFLGLVGLVDPPRPEAAEAVKLCKAAGIRPVMITGDHPATARAIARRLGIIEDTAEVLSGQDLARLSMAEFEEHVERVRVYARVAPEQKIKIVRALQDKGEFVAMTGDGVNDAPALKRADIGVAMGVTGTDVAKEAGHMILLDDNFASIVAAVREGRRIFDNIRKFIKYTMTSNSGEIWTIFLAPFLGLPIPLLPIHILWINLVTDGLPGLALAAEKAERGIMQRPPRPPAENIFAHGMWQHMVWVGLLMGAVSLFTQAWAIRAGNGHWQTMVFTVLTLSQLGHVLAIRSETESLFTQGVFSNRPLIGALLLTFGLQMATIYVPWLNPVFKTEPLTFDELAFCLAMSSVVFVAVEIEKLLIRRGWLYR